MSFLSWLLGFLGFGPPRRDVSRLGTISENEVDLVAEEVDLSGRPRKEGHLRKTLRDRRLLPKRKPSGPSLLSRKRRKQMTADEAGRLFSATMRNRDRSIRDLLPDEEQLARYGLPLWRTEEDLAAALGITVGELRFFSIHREKERVPHYIAFSIPKRDGGTRLIMAPKRRLKAIQRKLLELIVKRLPLSDDAHGFRSKRSVATGAAPHVGRRVVIHMDLKDFFPSVHVGRVRGLLVALGYGYPVATALAVLMTEAPRQPVDLGGAVYHVPVGSRYCVQGAPTSPGLCNCVATRLDRRLGGLARKLGMAYTRYADDLAFSGDDPALAPKLVAQASVIIRAEGFDINARKTRIMRRGGRQTVTGVVVNKELGLSRKERRRLRAGIHRLAQQQGDGAVNRTLLSRLRGKLAYLSMLNPKQAERLAERLPGMGRPNA